MSKTTSTAEKGSLSIHTENIFPIIKQFLYADQEVFLRELVSNAVDATQKLRKLAQLGEYKDKLEELRVEVKLNPTAKTLTISDSGIGMSREDIKEYINQIAFSGAQAFVEKYKQEGDKEIIGHFGLGFYSAFMVADRVEIHTLSYQTGAEAARWACDGRTDFEITKDVKKTRGTEVVLHMAEDAQEFLKKERITALLKKYCQFLPVEISFEGEIINQTKPPWTQAPTGLEEKDYTALYRRLYPEAPEPLFWIHLHVDYPFELNGILYFPPLGQEMGPEKHSIQLYSRQVFITEEVKDIVPPFLQLLHGVIDSPDIPLNVSRSSLQSDARVKKIHTHISKKVADKLAELFTEDQETFKKKWKDLGLFVKYGICSEEKFYERAQKFLLLENCKGEHYTLEEYRKQVATEQTDKKKQLVFLYTTDKEMQHGLIQQAEARGYDVLRMEGAVDTHLMHHLESKQSDIQWRRVDAASMDTIIDKGLSRAGTLSKEEEEVLSKLFEAHLKERQGMSLPLKTENAAETDPPLTLLVPEFIRRMQDMAAMSGKNEAISDTFELLVNLNHPLIISLAQMKEEKDQKEHLSQLYDLALLAQQRLKGKALDAFVKRNLALLQQKDSLPAKQ